ncbi:hypothetical protein BDR04DRAFT_1128841 [Suillus decipiens]|nr:hypothetical protein BDR04DRAFT_1128841 [Suillus decipiens]
MNLSRVEGSYLAIDGVTVDLFAKPAYFGETFYDGKSKYSLGCQAIITPHNLMIVDYSLGQPGSVYNAYAFKSTHLYEEHANLLPDGHWPWCIPPFKKPHNGRLTRNQRTFNYHLSKICVHIEHIFALHMNIKTEKHLQIAVHWIKCCLILHNMIIHFETCHCKQDKDYDESLEWAHKEGEGFIPQETEGLEGNEIGTPGQATHARLMDELFDSPRSRAHCRQG